MSYVVFIKRPEKAIAQSELESVVVGIAGFTPNGAGVVWQSSEPKATKYYFVLDDAGAISVSTPSNAALRAMQAVAGQLDARVVGEEGEDLTEVAVPEREASLWGCAVIIVALAAIGSLVWWLLQ